MDALEVLGLADPGRTGKGTLPSFRRSEQARTPKTAENRRPQRHEAMHRELTGDKPPEREFVSAMEVVRRLGRGSVGKQNR